MPPSFSAVKVLGKVHPSRAFSAMRSSNIEATRWKHRDSPHNNMCEFKYFYSEECGHQTIEVSSYCRKTIWSAGLSGILRPCPEKIYSCQVATDLLVQTTPQCWQGQSNFCRKCESDFQVRDIKSTKPT
jgi:hypothetical protein